MFVVVLCLCVVAFLLFKHVCYYRVVVVFVCRVVLFRVVSFVCARVV